MQVSNDCIAAECHTAPPKADHVWIGRMGTYRNAVTCCQRQRVAHSRGVTSMEATSDTGLIDMGHDCGIMAHIPVAITFAQIAIQLHFFSSVSQHS